MWDKILDASIFWSFDRSGFLRHEKNFDETYHFPPGSRALITGGTSGIGKAAALEMVKHKVHVTVTGRNIIKGNEIQESDPYLSFHQLDLAEWSEFDSLVDKLEPLDHLVLNAGGMPEKFSTNSEGIELQFASQLFGHYILTKKLSDAAKLKPGARIVWVTSGGMYLKALNLKTIKKNDGYDKIDQYANVKRAQVSLLPFFKEQFPHQTVIAMHPGWAETPGVEDSLPKFNKIMKGRLRTPLQGADTILWALGTEKSLDSGSLYFDRKEVSPHKFLFTRKSDFKTKELKRMLNSLTMTLILTFLSACTPDYDAKTCNELSMKKYKGIPHAHHQLEKHCQGFEIKYTPEVCQKALVYLMTKNSLLGTKKKFGDPIEHCFTGDDLRRFSRD